jgi:D-alanyl-D-alanine carboxypeptidase
MLCAGRGARAQKRGSFHRTLRLLGLAIAACSLLVASLHPVEARKKRGGYNPPYASIVVDANTGRVLQATHADAARFPASITKVMTLYMLFEQLERGRISLDTEFKVSANAARQAPSKIGFDPGETVSVDDAIKALITKSANDVAVVVAENLAGDEETFAERMTARARSLGMARTTFKNASGLPNREQVTTARDLSILGRAIHERFPRYWSYFQTRNFAYGNRMYRNHNRLLGRVEGVDGIKTGFTRASGFNLLTSARVDGRHVMAVVLGGRSGRQRDAQMAQLVENHIERAVAGRRTHSVLAEAGEAATRVASAEAAAPGLSEIERQRVAEATRRAAERQAEAARVEAARVEAARAEAARVERQRAEEARIAEARAQDERRAAEARRVANTRRAPVVQAAAPAAAPAAAAVVQARAAEPAKKQDRVTPVAFAAQPATPQGPQMRWAVGAQPVAGNITQGRPTTAPATRAAQVDTPATTASAPARAASAAPQRSGWVVQIGASDDEAKARAILEKARSRHRTVLADAESFTERVQRGEQTLFRARFGGFDNREADAACNALKRGGTNCFVQRI